MKITFTLDDVIRAKTIQFGKIYKKYINPNIDLSSLNFSSGDLQNIFNFKNKKEFEKFLYEDYAFEIFGEATTCDKQLDKKLNLWLLSLQNNEDIDDLMPSFALSNPYEFNNSIGYSYFFVSKIATRIREVFFPSNSNDIWVKSNVVVTADQRLLSGENVLSKGCIVVKIETDYNKQYEADLTYSSLLELLEDEEFFNKIIEIKNKRNLTF